MSEYWDKGKAMEMAMDEMNWPSCDRSPADQVQFNLDFEYFDAMIKHHHPELYDVFQAAFCGRTWQELSMPKRTFNWKLKKLENILAHLD